MSLFDQIEAIQVGMAQGLYSEEEYRSLLAEIVAHACILAEDTPHP